MPSASSTDIVPYDDPAKARKPARYISDRESRIVAGIIREFGYFQSARAMLGAHCEEVRMLGSYPAA